MFDRAHVLAYVLAYVLGYVLAFVLANVLAYLFLLPFIQDVAENPPKKLMYAKNVHSRAYNKRKLECRNAGMDHAKCLEEARAAGKKAIDDARAQGILIEDPEDVD